MQLTQKKYNTLLAIISICGTLSLTIIDFQTQPKKTEIREISEQLIGKKIFIEGKITSQFTKKNTLFLEITNKNKIKAIKFNTSKQESLTAQHADAQNFVKITGTVQKYNGELEIIADQITPLNKNQPT